MVSGMPIHRSALTEENASLSTLYHLLLEAVPCIANAVTNGDALAGLFQLLQRHDHALALGLETAAGAARQLMPYGDVAALTAPQADGRREFTCPLHGVEVPSGQIRYVFDSRASVTQELLDALTLQICLRLSRDGLAARIEAAEDRAHQRISEVAAIYEIGQAIDKIEHGKLLQMLTDRAAQLMEAATCCTWLCSDDGTTLFVAARCGDGKPVSPQEQQIAERVVTNEQSLLFVGGAQDLHDGANLSSALGSSLFVPMKSQDGRVQGVLSISRRRSAPDFTDSDLKLFSVFANQAALTLTNKRLYDDLNRRANELFKISTLSRTLISINLDELLVRVVDDICDTVGFERCCLYLREPVGLAFNARVWRGYNDAIGKNPIRDRDSAIGATARSKTLRIFDSREARPEGDMAEREYLQMLGFARSLGTDSFVAVPILTSKNDCVGVVVVDNKHRGRIADAAQTRLLTAFVSQAGLAIENARLHEKTQRLTDYTDNVLQSIGDGILSTDSRGHVARWNRAAAAILEQPSGFFRNITLVEVVQQIGVSPAEREHLLQMMARLPESGERMLLHELTLRPKHGAPRNLILKLFRLGEHGRERAGIVMMLEDVTQQVRMHAEIERMRRLADIGQLAAKMAHEVRNALSPIKGAAQIIRLEFETQGVSTEWPDIIVAEVDGLSRLTSAMLDFARPIPLDPRRLNIAEFLATAVQKLSVFLSEHRVDVEKQFAADLPEIDADPVQLGQVVRNVVMNAAQSMPDGGTLILGGEYDAYTEMVTLSFQDTGVGIEAEEKERIFRPFVTTKPKGTGLGLPIVQKIVDGHGGRVEVESTIGVGTCFRIVLPVRPPREYSEQPGSDAPLISSSLSGPFPDS
jgi:signal transduction histidine kinase